MLLKLKLRHRYTLTSLFAICVILAGVYLLNGAIKYTTTRYDGSVEGQLLRHARGLLEENLKLHNSTGHNGKDWKTELGSLTGQQSSRKNANQPNMTHVSSKRIRDSKVLKNKSRNESKSEKHREYILDNFGEQAWQNLQKGIYNNRNMTVITLNQYIQIAESHKNNNQENTTSFSYGVIKMGLQKWRSLTNELPLSPNDALKDFGSFLPWWEKLEILNYPEIYFIGIGANKTQFLDSPIGNFGFDNMTEDEANAGKYIPVIGDHISFRYETLEFLGKGTFGNVVKAFDHKTNEFVAIKIIANEIDWDDTFLKREIDMNLDIERKTWRKTFFPKFLDHFMFRNHKCIVMELLGESIHRKYRNNQPMRDTGLLRRMTWDILNGVMDLHEINIIHADLKPANIMFMAGKNNQSKGHLLKIADFGNACIRNSSEFKCPKFYAQTRLYRAPEVILGIPYNISADMWSIGLIVAETYNGNPIFWGESETDQLASMMEVLGVLPPFMVEQSSRKEVYFGALRYVTKRGFRRVPNRKPLDKVALLGAPKDLADFIKRCLTYNPFNRITAKEALLHPFVSFDNLEQKHERRTS